jgi:predicted Zn-dependent protease
MADVVRKNYDGAAEKYKQSLATGSTPNPATMVRLAQVYMSTGKLDNATFTLDKAINTPNVPDQVKTIAQNMKNDIAKRRPAAPAAAPASPAAPAPPASPAPPAGSQQP